MNYRKMLVAGVALLSACGCVPANKQLQRCMQQNQELEGRLAHAQAEIATLRSAKAGLEKSLAYQKEVSASSQKQNSALFTEYQGIKRLVRRALNQQFNALSALMEQEDLLDVVGYELLQRKHVAGNDLFLIDKTKKVAASGTLIGSWGYFSGPCTFRVQIIRPVENNHLVVWESSPLVASGAGLRKFAFKTPVRVLKDDLVGYRFEGPVNVPFDLGIGAFEYLRSAPSVGSLVHFDRLSAESDKRAYSLRAVGLLGL